MKSDHSLVTLNVSTCSEKRGRGFWKLNVSLLSDLDYVNMIKSVITSTIADYSHLNPSDLWELLKFYIRQRSISFSSKKARERKQHERDIMNNLATCEKCFYDDPSDSNKRNLDVAQTVKKS